MERFRSDQTPLKGLFVLERLRQGDTRGFFSRFFCATELREIGFDRPIAQINHTLTVRAGSIRGLHFQTPPYSEDKIVSCLKGEIFDVAVDLRRGSPTFLRWYGTILSAENYRSLVIPQGFAHGFQTLTDNCELLYLHSRAHAPMHEGAARFNDPIIGIEWPLTPGDLSERDQRHPLLTPEFTGI